MSGGFRSRSRSARAQKESPKLGGGQRSRRNAQGRRLSGDEQWTRSTGPARVRGRGSRNDRSGSNKKRAGDYSLASLLHEGADVPRTVALYTLLRVETEDAFANLVLPKALREAHVTGRDAAFSTEITYGTLRALGVVDEVIAKCASRPLEDMSPVVRNALRLGVYQALYTRVENHAAVDTTVRLVAHAERPAKGFSNAVMRAVTARPGDEWLGELEPADDLGRVAFRNAHPRWIAQSFARALGSVAEEELADTLAADSQRPVVHLAARPGEMSAEELALTTGNEVGKYSPYAVYMESGDPGKLAPVREGLAAVQDEGSQLIARAVSEAELSGKSSDRWLDLCAGPGGKTALMAAIARIEGATVDAVEVAPHRAELVKKTVGDLPVTVHVADGRNPGLEGGYDRVLVDAPCSGLGALRRRPEARWRKAESEIPGLNELQFELVASALKLVRPGGVVVYSTCSPDVRETRGVVDRAVEELGAVEEDAHELIPDMGDAGEHLSVQMWPHRHGTDAMFFAVLRRSN